MIVMIEYYDIDDDDDVDQDFKILDGLETGI